MGEKNLVFLSHRVCESAKKTVSADVSILKRSSLRHALRRTQASFEEEKFGRAVIVFITVICVDSGFENILLCQEKSIRKKLFPSNNKGITMIDLR